MGSDRNLELRGLLCCVAPEARIKAMRGLCPRTPGIFGDR